MLFVSLVKKYNFSVLIRCSVHISIIGLNSLNWIESYRHISLRRAQRPGAIRYKKCAQIFVADVNKSPIRYIIRDATKSYTVRCEHGQTINAIF